jgi:hypothetical protein
MRKFPAVLKSLLATDIRSVATIAFQSGTNPSSISRFCAGLTEPDPETFGKLLSAFDLRQRRALVAAWIEDRADEAGISLEELRNSLGVANIDVPEAIRNDLEILLSRGAGTKELAAMFRAVAACMMPFDQPHQGVAEDTTPPVISPSRSVTYKKNQTKK